MIKSEIELKQLHGTATRYGGDAGGWAVTSVSLLKELTGNDHDPVYRYAFIDEGHVAIKR